MVGKAQPFGFRTPTCEAKAIISAPRHNPGGGGGGPALDKASQSQGNREAPPPPYSPKKAHVFAVVNHCEAVAEPGR